MRELSPKRLARRAELLDAIPYEQRRLFLALDHAAPGRSVLEWPFGRRGHFIDIVLIGHRYGLEVNGNDHFENAEKYDERDEYLRSFGWHLKRIANSRVRDGLPALVAEILADMHRLDAEKLMRAVKKRPERSLSEFGDDKANA